MSGTMLLIVTIGSILLLLLLVVKARIQIFVSLIIVSIVSDFLFGIPPGQITLCMQEGIGETLGLLARVVAPGSISGKILYKPGVVDRVSVSITNTFVKNYTKLAMSVIGLVRAIPLFSGISAASAFLLPGSAPVLIASQTHADLGWMICLGIITSVIGIVTSGLIFGRLISRSVCLRIPKEYQKPVNTELHKISLFSVSIFLTLCPLVIVGIKSTSIIFLDKDSGFSVV